MSVIRISVIGCGRWGSFIAWYLNNIGHSVTLYARASSERMKTLMETRNNGLLSFDETIKLTTSLEDAVSADVIIISVNSQGLRSLMGEMAVFSPKNKTFVLCMKGIEIDSGKRLSEIAKENTDSSNSVAVWIGPGHVQDFSAGIPNCMVIDSESDEAKRRLVEEFSSELIRFYYGTDLIGNEIGAAAKNVVGIAAGILDGMKLSSLKGALMSRGTREIARLIAAMGGNEMSAYGLCHLGDYEATLFSPHSHNRRFGECFVTGEAYTELAEGYYTVKALVLLGEKHGVELPICRAVYDILYNGADVKDALSMLFSRNIKNEF